MLLGDETLPAGPIGEGRLVKSEDKVQAGAGEVDRYDGYQGVGTLRVWLEKSAHPDHLSRWVIEIGLPNPLVLHCPKRRQVRQLPMVGGG
jgi:hypothetical protein